MALHTCAKVLVVLVFLWGYKNKSSVFGSRRNVFESEIVIRENNLLMKALD